MNVGVVDYGIGNQLSVCHALEYAGAEPVLVRTPEEVLAATRLVLPGVGAAGPALERIRSNGLEEALTEAVVHRGRPLMGICLGMQLLAEDLNEFGSWVGMGWMPGQVVDLHDLPGHHGFVPHMGWSEIEVDGAANELFKNVRSPREFYFCHSFTLTTPDPSIVAARTSDDSAPLVAAIARDSIFATQFHPEKSQIKGLRLLEAFLDWAP